MIVSQFTNRTDMLRIVRLLNLIEIALDPIILSALDVRFWKVWENMWRHVKNRYFPELQLQPKRKTDSTY